MKVEFYFHAVRDGRGTYNFWKFMIAGIECIYEYRKCPWSLLVFSQHANESIAFFSVIAFRQFS